MTQGGRQSGADATLADERATRAAGGGTGDDGGAVAAAGKDTRAFSAWERMIAWRYLRARRKESFISVISIFSFIGIMLGVATLIVVMSVMNGFRAELIRKILGFSGHVTIYHDDFSPIFDHDRLIEKLRKMPYVVEVAPFVEGQVMATSRKAASGVKVRGLRGEDLNRLSGVANDKLRGSLEGFDQSDGVVIGYRLAWKHGLNVGDVITLIAPEGEETPFGVTPRITAFKVLAIFESGMSLYDANFVYMPLKAAQDYFNTEGGVTGIELKVRNPDEVERTEQALVKELPPGFRIITWKRANAVFFSALAVEKNVMFIILTLIILVAALNIISGLIMLVKDKAGDIAILRTMGAGRGSVLRIFFLTGAAIGIAGTIAGVILGVVVALNVENIRQFLIWATGANLFPAELYYLNRLPSELDVGQVLGIAAFSLALSFLATIYPAWRAANMDPVEALRHE